MRVERGCLPPRGANAEAIFIVHGRNDAAKLAVHGFLRDATDLDPVILHNVPNLGRTLIEKFESVGAEAAFAVVILTADDVGRAKQLPSGTAARRVGLRGLVKNVPKGV